MGISPMRRTAVPAVQNGPVFRAKPNGLLFGDGPETHGQAQRAPAGDAHATFSTNPQLVDPTV